MNTKYFAKLALARVQDGTADSLTDAVTSIRENEGLSDEQTKRLCEATNRATHALNFDQDAPDYVTFEPADPVGAIAATEKNASAHEFQFLRPTSRVHDYRPGEEFCLTEKKASSMIPGDPAPKIDCERVYRETRVLNKEARGERIVRKGELSAKLAHLIEEATNALYENTLDEVAYFVGEEFPSDIVKRAFPEIRKIAENRRIKVRRGPRPYLKKRAEHPLAGACRDVVWAEERLKRAISLEKAATSLEKIWKNAALNKIQPHEARMNTIEAINGVHTEDIEKIAFLSNMFGKKAGLVSSLVDKALMGTMGGTQAAIITPLMLKKQQDEQSVLRAGNPHSFITYKPPYSPKIPGA